jgi:hypothetical protein
MLLRFEGFIVTIKMLAYRVATNSINEYYRLSESLAHEKHRENKLGKYLSMP